MYQYALLSANCCCCLIAVVGKVLLMVNRCMNTILHKHTMPCWDQVYGNRSNDYRLQLLHVLTCLMSARSCRNFTDTALSLALTLLNSLIDLLSFSGILYSIYPPLFLALVTYSVGGTVVSVLLGKVCCCNVCLLTRLL